MKPNCSHHKKCPEALGMSEAELAQKVGDLHYFSLELFLYELRNKLRKDSEKDDEANRTLLANNLRWASEEIHEAAESIAKAYDICKEYMREGE